MVWASYSQFQQVRTRKKQFVCLCHAQQPVSTTSHNQFELVSTTRKNQFWASHSQFQSQGKMVWATASFKKWEPASYSQFNENQFEDSQFQQPGRTCLSVTANFNDKEKHWANYSQFQQVRTRKNQFELVTASLNASLFVSCSQFQQPGRTSFELVTTSFNHKEKWFELVTASFNKWEPGRTSLFVCVMHNSQFQSTSHKSLS